jgi:hypothetical protein
MHLEARDHGVQIGILFVKYHFQRTFIEDMMLVTMVSVVSRHLSCMNSTSCPAQN